MFDDISKKNEPFILPVAIIFSFLAILFGCYFMLFHNTKYLHLQLFIMVPVGWLFYPILKYFKNYSLAMNWIIFTMWTTLTAQAFVSGTYESPGIWWLIFIPTLSALLLNQIYTIIWSLLNILSLIFLSLPHLDLLPKIQDMENNILNYGVNTFAILFITSILLILLQERYNTSQRRKESLKIEGFIKNNFHSLAELSSSIAHEINNPLFVIKGNANILEDKITQLALEDDTKQAILNHLRKIDLATSKATKTTKSLAQLTKGISVEQKEVFPIYELIRLMYEINMKKFLLKNIEFQIPEPKGLDTILVNASKGQIIQVFINILNNSYEAVGDKLSSWIKINVELKGDILNIYFIDSGQGIDPVKGEKLFKPLYSTKDEGAASGLGLSLCRMILEKNFGRIWIDYASRNTCFVISLPIIKK